MDTVVIVGDATFRIAARRHEGQWIAYAEREDSGERVGPLFAGEEEGELTRRVAAWLEWQHEHAAALAALQDAERAYQRSIAGSAFASATEDPLPIEIQKESLLRLEEARLRLDEIRRQKPE